MALSAIGPPESEPLVLRDLPEPVPGPGEARVRVTACGVCRTDLRLVEGDLEAGKPDLAPGHQAVGEVDALGPGLTDLRLGDKVGVTWLHSTWGRCEHCRSVRENLYLCDRARFTGLHADGGYAEALVVPASHAFRLPEGLDPMQAVPLLCAGVIGWRSMRISGIRPGEILGLLDFGASAHLTLQAAQDRLRKGGIVAVNAVHMDPLPPIPYPMLYQERSVKSVAVNPFPLEEADLALSRLKASALLGSAVRQVRR